MNRRIAVPLVLIVGLGALGVLLQASGRYAGGGISGAATGGAGAGCESDVGLIAPGALANVRHADPDALGAPAGPVGPPPADVVPGRYVVKLRPDLATLGPAGSPLQTGLPDLDSLFSELGSRDARTGVGGLVTVGLDGDLVDIQTTLYANGAVEWVEPVLAFTAASAPDDPLYPLQWPLHGLAMEAVHAITTGQGITVAILDSGIVPGPDGVANLAPGLDFIDGDEDPTDADAIRTPNGSHGTHVAGVIAQATDNGIGGAGLAPGVTVLPIRVLGWDSERKAVVGHSDRIAEAIIWAADHGAAVIHMSIASPTFSKVVADACDYAYDQGLTLVAAAGNGGHDDHIDFPAALASVIAVGATTLNHEVAPYSNRGGALELVAPGGSLMEDADGDGQLDGVGAETFIDGHHDFLLVQGTSQAAAHVSAAAALLRSQGIHSPTDVRGLLQASALRPDDAGRNDVYGFGELSIDGALALHQASAETPPEDILPTQTDAVVTPLGPDRAVIQWTTSVELDTTVSDDEGILLRSEARTLTHTALVIGAEGEEARYLLQTGAAEERVLEQEVLVLFGLAPLEEDPELPPED